VDRQCHRAPTTGRGDYFFFAFHDDPVRPTYVSRLVEALTANPDAVLAFSDIELGAGTKAYLELERVHNRLERATRMIRKKGAWWIPNRGLFKASAGKRIGGVHRHLGGEYSADAGSFIWPFSASSSACRSCSCGRIGAKKACLIHGEDVAPEGWRRCRMREVRRAGLPPTEEMAIHREIVVHGLSALWPKARE
jgi:hypothetical protein